MQRLFLVMVVSALLVTYGLAQAPDAAGNTNPVDIKGCLGGSDGNYTIAQDGTRQTFKITTSSVDLKPHLGHDVKLTGQKATGGSSPADSSFAVTGLSMISDHCTGAAAAPVAAVIPPSETIVAPDPAAAAPVTASAPPADAAAPAATVSPSGATATTPSVDAAAPAATVTPSAATASTPPVDTAVPVAVSPSPTTASTLTAQTAAPAAAVAPPAAPVMRVVEAAPATRPSAHARKLAATKAAATTVAAKTVAPSPEPVSPPASDPTTPPVAATAVSPSAEAVSAPDTAAPTPALSQAPQVTHRAGSLTLLVAFVVLVIVLGTTAPLIGRWRKRKMLERDGSPNLSFTNEVSVKDASSGETQPEPRKVA